MLTEKMKDVVKTTQTITQPWTASRVFLLYKRLALKSLYIRQMDAFVVNGHISVTRESGLQCESPKFEHRCGQLFVFLFSFCLLIIHKVAYLRQTQAEGCNLPIQ